MKKNLCLKAHGVQKGEDTKIFLLEKKEVYGQYSERISGKKSIAYLLFSIPHGVQKDEDAKIFLLERKEVYGQYSE